MTSFSEHVSRQRVPNFSESFSIAKKTGAFLLVIATEPLGTSGNATHHRKERNSNFNLGQSRIGVSGGALKIRGLCLRQTRYVIAMTTTGIFIGPYQWCVFVGTEKSWAVAANYTCPHHRAWILYYLALNDHVHSSSVQRVGSKRSSLRVFFPMLSKDVAGSHECWKRFPRSWLNF